MDVSHPIPSRATVVRQTTFCESHTTLRTAFSLFNSTTSRSTPTDRRPVMDPYHGNNNNNNGPRSFDKPHSANHILPYELHFPSLIQQSLDPLQPTDVQ
eukprot:jgi/Psemu1/300065/fgenesh1_kg.6_\